MTAPERDRPPTDRGKITPLHRALVRGERELAADLMRTLRTRADATAALLESPVLSETSIMRSDALIAGALSRHVSYVEDETERVIFYGSTRTRNRAWAALLLMLGLGERPAPPRPLEADRTAARVAAKALAAVVGGALLYAARRGANVVRELRRGPGLAKTRVDQIATTETARAVADEARLVTSAPALVGTEVLYEWSSVLDARRCRRCAALDGARVKRGKLFEGGMWPPAHPRCRCVPIPIIVPVRLPAAAAAA